ncbi:cyclophilin-like fold protein [Butyrivibrio fibrisolvens]|uniref:cyclophilin-like fold protein n=1 Tax=Butyrivibrio fibrisolvens TaxID=831 RepID=UPI0020BDDE52|nr:cyclophilin-like fold protein [Butyrivibrio fibrisolvens]
MVSEIHTGRGGIYYKQDMYSFLFTLSVVLIALALSYLFFHGREHTTIGRFIIYCSVNLAAGDIVLDSGNQIVVFYGSNSWSYTRLGKINLSEKELTDLLGNEDVTLEIEKR